MLLELYQKKFGKIYHRGYYNSTLTGIYDTEFGQQVIQTAREKRNIYM